MSVCCVVTVHGRDELLTDIVEDPTPPPPQSAEMENGWAGDVTELESACPPQLERVRDDELAASVSVASDDSSCPLLECQHLRSPLLQPLDESLALDTELADARQSTVVSVEPADLPESLVCPDVVRPSGGSRDESTVVSVEPSDPREETVVVSTMPSGPQEHILDRVELVQFQEECIASGMELADQQESTVVSRRPTDPPESSTLPAEPVETVVRSLNTEASDAQMCVLVDTESAESTDPQESMISLAVRATIPSSPGDLATSTSECSEARVSTDNDTSAGADESEASEGRAQVMDASSESLTAAAAESAAILTPESRDAMTSQSDRVPAAILTPESRDAVTSQSGGVPAAILAPESRDAVTSQSGGVCADAETDAGRGQPAADGRDDVSEMSGACSLQLPASAADAATWRDAGDWSGRSEHRQELCADTNDVSAVQQLAELETASTARLITAHDSVSSTSSCGSASGLAGVGDNGPCSQNDESIAGREQLELSSDSAAVSSQQHVAHSDDDIVSSDLQLSRSTEHTTGALQTDDRVRGDDEGQTRCSDVAEAGMMRSDETGAGGTVMTAAVCSDANIGVTASDGGVDVHACSTERCSGGTDAVDRCGCGVQCSYCYYSVASIRLLRQHSVFHVAFTDAARTPLFHATLDALVDGRMDDPRLYDSTAPLTVALCEPCRRLAAWHHSCDATATRHAPPAPAAAAASGMRDTGALLTDAATGDVRDEVKANDDEGLADSTDPGTVQCASGLDTATDAGGLRDVHDEAKDDQGVAEADNRLDVTGDLQAKTVTDTGTFLVRDEVKDDQRLANSAAADSQLDTEAGVQAAENTDIAVDESAVDTSLGSSAERTEAIAKKSSPDSWNDTNSAAADELDTEADVLAAENTDVRAVAESAMTVLESRYSQRDISPVLSNSTARHSSHKPVVSSSGRSDAQLYGAVTSQPLDDKVHFLSTLSLHSVT